MDLSANIKNIHTALNAFLVRSIKVSRGVCRKVKASVLNKANLPRKPLSCFVTPTRLFSRLQRLLFLSVQSKPSAETSIVGLPCVVYSAIKIASGVEIGWT